MTGGDPVCPDFEGGWIGAVPSALEGVLAGEPPPDWLSERVAGVCGVVLLVIDGLGWEAVGQHAGHVPTLAAMTGGPITTVAPSTTAAALTSIASGVAPGEHGVVGYRMRVGGDVLNVLKWSVGDGKPPEPASVQGRPAFGGRPRPAVTRADFKDTGFTQAHLGGANLEGWNTPAGVITQCRRLSAAGTPFIYAYYDGVDKVAHAHGLRDAFYIDELHATDRLVGDVLSVLPADYALVVTADHGQVHIGGDGWQRLAELDELVSLQAGDGRFRYLHARPGASRDLAQAAVEVAGARAWVLTREELVDSGWLGRKVGPTVSGRLGDVILAARDHYAFIDPRHERETKLIAGHGSLTSAEMRVPLLVALAG
ncbi:MAG: alkaline phosphatase family protein [Egibacteraceae bacterium]